MAASCWTRRSVLAGGGGVCGSLLFASAVLGAETAPSNGGAGSGDAGNGGQPFPLRVATNERYLTDCSGRPFLINGDTAWSLIGDLPREDALRYLEDRRRRGFNTILVNLIEHHFARTAPKNFYGAAPFSTPGDFSSPNEDYFTHADWVIERAAALGLVLLLTPAYLGYNGGREGWYREMLSSGVDKLRIYGEFLGKRYARFSNIIWLHGGDFNPPRKEVVETIAEAIRRVAPGAIHSAHCGPETTASNYWGAEDWLDLDTLYTRGPVFREANQLIEGRQIRPFIMLEGAYESEHGAGGHRLRTQAYQALLSGACGHVFGNNPIWHFEGPGIFNAPQGWRAALDSPGAHSMSHLARLFGSLPWWELVPDSHNRLLVTGAGNDDDRAVAAYSEKRTLAIVYAPTGRMLDLDTSMLVAGNVEARWFDPTSGTFHQNSIPVWPSYGIQQVRTPGLNAAGDPDWVLMLRTL